LKNFAGIITTPFTKKESNDSHQDSQVENTQKYTFENIASTDQDYVHIKDKFKSIIPELVQDNFLDVAKA